MKSIALCTFLTSLVLAAPRVSGAGAIVAPRPLLPAQMMVAGRAIQKLRPLALGHGSLLAGGVDAGRDVLLKVSLDTPGAPPVVLVAPGAPKAAPGAAGQVWGQDLRITDPAVDGAGNVAFGVADGGPFSFEQWVWEAGTGQLRPVGKSWSHLPAGALFTLLETPLSASSAGAIAFMDLAPAGAGALAPGIFVHAPDGTERPVAVPGQLLDGQALLQAVSPSVSDGGSVAFLASRSGQGLPDAYVASPAGQSFQFTRIPLDAALATGFEPSQLFLSRDGKSLLVEGFDSPDPSSIDTSLWLSTSSGLQPLLVKGRALPGGGMLQSLQLVLPVTPWNAQGRFAVLADLAGGGQALYLGDAQGQLSLLLQSGMTTSLGPIKTVGELGVALGDDGSIAAGLTFAGGAPADGIFLIPPL